MRRAIIVAEWYWRKGWAVALPTCQSSGIMFPLSWEEWLAQDLAMVERCDQVIRVPEISQGTTLEVAHGKELGIEIIVYHLRR